MSDTEENKLAPEKIKGVRLNGTMRNRAINALVKFALNNTVRDLLVRQADLADRAYNDVLTPDHRKLLSQIPKDWDGVKQTSNITINAGGWQVTLHFFDMSILPDDVQLELIHISAPMSTYHRQDGSFYNVNEAVRLKTGSENFNRPWPFKHPSYNSGVTYQSIIDPDLVAEIQKFSEDVRSANEEIKSLQAELTGLIGSFTTVAKLLEAMPEISELVPDLCPEIESKNLAPVIDNVRARILNMRGEANDKTSKEAMEKRKPVPTINITT